jgi:antitoxin MazE
METRIQKWGNSLGVRLPKEILNKTQLREGSCVNITNKRKLIFIESCVYERPSLESLVRKINAKNIHRELEWDNSYGKETW